MTIMNNEISVLLQRHLDLTCLNETATEKDITQLCETAKENHTAAVCVYPFFINHCHALLKDTTIKVATVANFPQGDFSLSTTCDQITKALEDQVDEIDLVLPYTLFLKNEIKKVKDYLATCKKQLPDFVKLKIILETGALKTKDAIHTASLIALEAGADFLKTSTGKIAVGATLEAAEIILKTMAALHSLAGFKVSGGIKTQQTAYAYYCLTEQILEKKLDTSLFRIGASQLLA